MRSLHFIVYYYGVVITSPSTNPELFYGHDRGAWFALAWLEGETLGAILKERRADLDEQSGFLSQTKMSVELKRKFKKLAPSQSTISNIENEAKDISDFYPEVILELLKLYHFTEEELNTLNERFSLKLPLSRESNYLNNIGTTDQFSATVFINDVLNAGAGERLPVPKSYLEEKGVEEKDCRALLIDDNVLMPEVLRTALPSGMYLVITEAADPKPESLMAYKCGSKYVVLRNDSSENKVPVMTLDGAEGDFVSKSDERLAYLGVSIGRFFFE